MWADGCWSWLVVFASLLVQFITSGLGYSAGIYQLTFLKEFEESQFQTSWIGSMLLGFTAFGGIIGVYVSRNLSCRTSVVIGGIVVALGFGLSRLAWEHWILYFTIGLVGGLGLGLSFSPSIMIVEQHFMASDRSFALGLAVWGIGMGIATFPPCMHLLIEHFAWKGAVLILAGIGLNISFLGSLMRPPPGGKRNFVPFPLFEPSLMKNPNFLVLCLSNFLWSFAASVIYTYIPVFASKQGSDDLPCSLLISIIGISLFVSRTLFRLLQISDIFINLLCSIGISMILACLWEQLFEKFTGIVGYCMLFGFYSGFWSSFSSHTTKDLIGREYAAMGNGYLTVAIGIGCVTGAPLAGFFYDETDDFRYIFYLAGGFMLLSSTIMILAKCFACAPTAPPYGYVVVERKTGKTNGDKALVKDEKETLWVDLMLTSV